MSMMADSAPWTSSCWEKSTLGPPTHCKKDADHSPPLSPIPKDDSPKTNYFDSKYIATLVQDGKVGVAEEVALAMGIPKPIVQLAKAYHFTQHGSLVPDASALFEAAEVLLSSPEKQAHISDWLHEQFLKEEEQASKKYVVDNKGRESPSPPTAEMLKDKVKRLAQENHRLRQRKTCYECKKVDLAASGVTFLPCGHFITCETCSEQFDNCPACNKTVMGTVRTYLS